MNVEVFIYQSFDYNHNTNVEVFFDEESAIKRLREEAEWFREDWFKEDEADDDTELVVEGQGRSVFIHTPSCDIWWRGQITLKSMSIELSFFK